MQLFDTDESLTRSVAAFLHRGFLAGELLLVVATRKHWNGISSRLWRLGAGRQVLNEERWVFWNAEETLGRFLRRGRPNRALFTHSVANAVQDLRKQAPDGLRVYGEMVELLAREANFRAAAELEGLWNEVRGGNRFTLLCGYSAAHFAGPDAGSALTSICSKHTHSISKRSDPLGRFLLASEEQREPSMVAPDLSG